MTFYLIILVIILGLCFLNHHNPHKYYTYIGFILLFLVSAFRAEEVGTDLQGYVKNFMSGYTYTGLKGELEWGYAALTEFLLLYSDKSAWYIIATSILTLIPLFFFIHKNSLNPVFSLLIFFIIINGFGFFLTGIRQSIALVITLWGYHLFDNKKIVYAVALILLASTVHASALFCLLFLLASLAVNVNIKKTLYAVLMISIIIGFIARVDIFDMLPVLGKLPGYADVVKSYSYYTDYSRNVLPNFNGLFLTIIPTSLFAFLAIKYNATSVYSKLLYIGAVLTNVFASTPTIPRYFIYGTFLQIIIIPTLFPFLKQEEKTMVVGVISLLIFYFLFMSLEINGIDNYVFR